MFVFLLVLYYLLDFSVMSAAFDLYILLFVCFFLCACSVKIFVILHLLVSCCIVLHIWKTSISITLTYLGSVSPICLA